MTSLSAKDGYFVHQNLGLFDRVIRVAAGVVLIVVPYMALTTPGATAMLWHGISMMMAIYFCLTGMLGTDPLMRINNMKTCDTSERNQCGSFPYQVDALLGHHPVPEDHTEHSLLHSHHAK